MKAKALIAASLVTTVLAIVAMGWLAYRQLEAAGLSLQTLYEDRLLAADQLRRVHAAVGERTSIELHRLAEAPPESPDRLRALDALEQIQDEAQRQWAAYERTFLVQKEQELLPSTRLALGQAWRGVQATTKQLLEETDPAARLRLAHRTLLQREDALLRLSALLDVQVDVGEDILTAAQADRRHLWAVLTALFMMACVLVVISAVAVLRTYRQKLKQWQDRQTRLQGFYGALSAVNQLILRVENEQDLYREVCAICVNTGHARIAGVVTLEGEEASLAQTSAMGSEAYGILDTRWNINDPDQRSGLASTVLRTGSRVVVDDVLDLRRLPPRHHKAIVAAGVRSQCGLPITQDGKVVAALSLHAQEPHFFDADVCRLLDELAADISFALQVLHTREAARRSYEHAVQVEATFRHLVKFLPVRLYVIDMDSQRLLEINDEACHRHGCRREEALGRTIEEVSGGRASPQWSDLRHQIADQGQVIGMEKTGTDRSGRTYHSLIYGTRMNFLQRDASLICVADITELKAAQQRVQDLAAEEAAAKARSSYIAKLSHELKTPLNAILGFSQLLARRGQERGLADELVWIERIQSAGRYLLALVGDVLDLSKLDHGRLNIQLSPVSLAPSLQEPLAMTRVAALQRGITVQVEPIEPGLAAMADERRLQQVFVNLLSNAVKYNREGGWVRVAAHAEEREAGRVVRVSVADGGIGMSEDQLGQLFQPYNRLGRDTSGTEGTGLGLVLTKELVELMGGQLEFESRSGQGTTAIVVLQHAEAGSTSTAAASGLPTARDTPVPRSSILYIEDNPVNTLLVNEALATLPGLSMMTAEDGVSGIERARSDRPDLILLDMHLPDIDGLEVLRRLKADERTRHVPVIALSAEDDGATMDEARQAGAADYWTKPIVLDAFLAGVARQLSSRRPRPAADPA